MMQNEESIEKMDIIENFNSTVLPRSPSKQSQIYRIRKTLLMLLSILFAFDLIYLIFIAHAYIDHLWMSHYCKNNYELLWTLVSIMYDAFGLLVIYRYYRTGLCVFAWIGTICLILVDIVAGIICTIAVYTTNHMTISNGDIIGPLIFIMMLIGSAIFLLIIVLLSFKLSKLIINNQNTTTQSI